MAQFEAGFLPLALVAVVLGAFLVSAIFAGPYWFQLLWSHYEDGDAVEQNYALAAEWYRKAAEHVPDLGGAGQGRNHLGLLYMEGLGVPLDYVQAYMWFSLARVDENIAYAAERMNAGQILLARQMTDEWKKQHPDPTIH